MATPEEQARAERTFYLFDCVTGEFVVAYHMLMHIFDFACEEDRAFAIFNPAGRSAALMDARNMAQLAKRMTGRCVGIGERSTESGNIYVFESPAT